MTQRIAGDALMRAGGSEVAEVRGARIISIDNFEPAVVTAQDAREAWTRRFSTLFLHDDRWRRGGMGRVAHATNLAGESVAVKVMTAPERHELETEEDYARRFDDAKAAFRTEYQTLLTLSGMRGFCRPFGYGALDGSPAIVMEWVEGVSLAQAARELAIDGSGRVSPLTVARLGRDLFALLTRLGSMRGALVHRDISPANVLVRTAHLSVIQQEQEGAFDLCLIDFGSATASDAGSASFTQARSALRGATAEYAPPEMLSDDLPHLGELRRSPSIDVYAGASVLFELLGGVPPFALEETARNKTARDASNGAADATETLGYESAYRKKVDHKPLRLATAHDQDFDPARLPQLEPEVAVAVANAMFDDPGAALAEVVCGALELVDWQLSDVITSCLTVRQEARPSAEAVHAALETFVSNYPANVQRALSGDVLIPCTAGSEWYASASPVALRRMLRSAGTAASAAVWLVVVFSLALLLEGRAADVSVLGHKYALTFGFVEVAALFAVPLLLCVLVRRNVHEGARRFAWGSVTVAVATAALAAVMASVTLHNTTGQGALLAGAFASGAALWCPLVLEYATEVLPAYRREAQRRLLRGAARPSYAVLNGETTDDASE